ncbi:hypothetical protein RP20_CCG027911 [Aedes albopictus]|nr:hypothetical protein RP20_CCG027911 [Aedes albopictus]
MKNFDIASRYQLDNNCKRTMLCAGKMFRIPVYVDSDAVTVRIHDLPLSMDNSTISDHMLKYGEVISIRNDTWKHYFAGLPNGVRVLRMRLLRDIPSYITIENERTMVSYLSQPKLCYQCGQPAHPKEKCPNYSSSTSNKTTSPHSDELFNHIDFPPINNTNEEPSPAVNEPTSEEPKTQNNEDWTDVEDNASTSSGDFNVVTHKRRRSNKQKDNATKKVCAEQGSSNTGHNAAVIDTPSEEKNIVPKNKNRKGVTLPIYNTK